LWSLGNRLASHRMTHRPMIGQLTPPFERSRGQGILPHSAPGIVHALRSSSQPSSSPSSSHCPLIRSEIPVKIYHIRSAVASRGSNRGSCFACPRFPPVHDEEDPP
jgi:hypothetical protein